MANTRRSTRQSTATVPNYADDDSLSSEADALKRNGKQAPRKRARETDDGDVADGPPKPKKVATARSKKVATAQDKPPSKTPVKAPAASATNRDADGQQQTYWLFKAEPIQRYEKGVKSGEAFSIDDLAACTKPEPWSGVRNPQACNIMKEMREGDLGFFYHSNAKPSGVVGMLKVVEEAKVDESAFDTKDPYYDPKSSRDKPRWFCVGVEFVKKFDGVVDLHKIKSFAAKGGPLENMQLVKMGRLSVCRVTKDEWHFINKLAQGGEEEEAKGVEKGDAADHGDHIKSDDS